MAFLGDEPKHELIVERVPGGRRAALIVGIVAVLIVAALVWKPWDNGVPAATPTASLPLVAAPAPTAEPTAVSASPEPAATTPAPPPAVAQPPVDPTTDFPSAQNLGTVSFPASGGPSVHCLYEKKPDQLSATLTSLIVESPVVFPSPRSSASKVRLHVRVESNRQDKLFEAEWQPLLDTPYEHRRLKGFAPALFDSVFISVPTAGPVMIYRATLVVEWLDLHGHTIETQEIHPTIYGPMGDANFPLGPGGCAATAS